MLWWDFCILKSNMSLQQKDAGALKMLEPLLQWFVYNPTPSLLLPFSAIWISVEIYFRVGIVRCDIFFGPAGILCVRVVSILTYRVKCFGSSPVGSLIFMCSVYWQQIECIKWRVSALLSHLYGAQQNFLFHVLLYWYN